MNGRPARVLLVEDDAGLSEVMADELEALEDLQAERRRRRAWRPGGLG